MKWCLLPWAGHKLCKAIMSSFLVVSKTNTPINQFTKSQGSNRDCCAINVQLNILSKFSIFFKCQNNQPCLPWGTKILRYKQSSLPWEPDCMSVTCKHRSRYFVAFNTPGSPQTNIIKMIKNKNHLNTHQSSSVTKGALYSTLRRHRHCHIITRIAIIISTNKQHTNMYSPFQPGWGLGFSNLPGMSAKGTPLKTSTERKSPMRWFFPSTMPPSVDTAPS